jgi:hypothetical protein
VANASEKDKVMEWIDYEEQYPNTERIVCYNELTEEVFNMDLVESKWGNQYRNEKHELRDYTHWIPREK